MSYLEYFFDKKTGELNKNYNIIGNELIVKVDSIDSMQKLDKVIDFLQSTNNNKIDTIVLNSPKDYLDKKQDLDVMRAYAEYIDDKHNDYKLKVSLGEHKLNSDRDMYSDYENLSIAHKVVDDFVKKVNAMTIDVDGKPQPLSPLEKYMVVYEFCAHRVYKEDEHDASNSRTWINVLAGDKVVCVGFASLLKCLCDRIFDEKELACLKHSSTVYDKQGKCIGGHSNNIIIINDDKYNVHGVFHSDACWGAIRDNNPNVDYTFALVPIEQMSFDSVHNYSWDDSKFLYDKLPVEEGSFGYYEHHTYAYLMHYLGHENYEEMKERFNKERDIKNNIIKENNKKIDGLNDKIDEELRAKTEPILAEFITKNDLKELMSLPFIGVRIGDLVKTPCVAKIYDYLNNISLETIGNITKQDLLEYKQFVEEHKEFFDSKMTEIKDAFAYFGEIDIDFSLKSRVVKEIIKEAPHYAKEQLNFDYIQPFEEYKEYFDKTIKENKDFIYTKPLSKKQLATALIPVAKALGVDAKEYVTEVISHTQKRTEYRFNHEYFEQYDYDIVGKPKHKEKERVQ